MSIVTGENVVIKINDGGMKKIYACARNCSLTVNTDVIETSTQGSGKWATFEPTKHNFTGSIDGIVNLNMANTLSLSDLRAKQLAMEVLSMEYDRIDNDGNIYNESGDFIITSSVDNGNIDDVATFSISLQGTGQLIQSFIPSPSTGNKVKTYDYTATGGASSFSSAAFFGKEILNAFKSGQRYKVALTGSPSGLTAVYTEAGGEGTIAFAEPFENEELGAVEYQDF